jgi:hypothetical protein
VTHTSIIRAQCVRSSKLFAKVKCELAPVCLIVVQRFTSMNSNTFRISRWVLSLELVVCFLPITAGWFDAVFGDSGVTRLSSSVIGKYFLDAQLNRSILGMMIGGAVVGLVGPIGLFLTLRAATTGRGLRSRTMGIVMIVGVVSYAMASVVLRLVGGPGAYAATVDFIVLMIMLPAAGTAHLMYLATPAGAELVRS